MPNIAIYEGGKAARMNGVSRITTDDGNDGKIVWVPQSDRQTGTLYVSENGTYRAEDEGLHSWSKVTVRLAGAPLGLEVPTLPDPVTGAEIPTGELGELEPVPPAGLEPIEDEPISADEAEKILEEAGLDPSDLESDDALEAIADALGTDPEDVKVIDPEKNEDVKKEQPKVEDKGQKAVGTDPDTGEPATITPSGKDGAIVPDELRILVEPSKKTYEDGDTIDYTGIVCGLYKDGRFIRNAEFDELEFQVTTAEYDKEKPEYTDGDGVNFVELTTHAELDQWRETVYVGPIIGTYNGQAVYHGTRGSGTVRFTLYNDGSYDKVWASGVGKNVGLLLYTIAYYQREKEYRYTQIASISTKAPDGSFTDTWGNGGSFSFGIPRSTKNPNQIGPKWYSVGMKVDLPVRWGGEYGASLTDSFEVTVTYTEIEGS